MDVWQLTSEQREELVEDLLVLKDMTVIGPACLDEANTVNSLEEEGFA